MTDTIIKSAPSSASATMQQLIRTILIGSLVLSVVVCKPNSSNSNNNNNQQSIDKQLLRKTLSDESARAAAAANQASNQNQPNINSENGGGGPTNRADVGQSSSTTISFQCPEQFGYYTDTKDCTKYYVCVFGEVLHESCTGGLRFSRELQTCDWPRNVDCQQATSTTTNDSSTMSSNNNNNQLTSPSPMSSSSTLSPPPSLTTTNNNMLTTTATISSTASSTGGGLLSAATLPNKQQQSSSNNNNNQVQDQSNNNENNQERSMKGSSSMVFADEGSDPQQPSFDEAVSPVITADGAIHLHDGSGGTFSLTPNHNRALQNSSPQSGGDLNQNLNSQNPPIHHHHHHHHQSAAAANHQNVNVFVKPLMQQQQNTIRQQATTRQQQQQQFQQATSGQMNQKQQTRQQQQQQQPRLQAVTLPNQPQQNNPPLDSNNEMSELLSSSPREQPVDFTDDPSGDNGGDRNTNEGGEDNTGGVDELPLPPNVDSISAQADQESMMNENPAAAANLADPAEPNFNINTDQFSGGDQSDNDQANPATNSGNSYIPPVSASSNNNNNNNMQQQQRNQARQQTPANNIIIQNSNNNARQSSQLLSINNRQVVDPTRQSFKPILIADSQPNNQQLISSSQQQAMNSNNFNQRQHNQDNRNSNNNNKLTNLNHQRQNNNNQFVANNSSSSSSSAIINNRNSISNNNAQQQQQQQTNRQSRTSANFQPNQFAAPPNQAANRAAPLLLPPNQQIDREATNLFLNNNKQTSQNSNSNQLIESIQAQNQSPLVGGNTFKPRFPTPTNTSPAASTTNSRSQNVLFSQQPFGFVAENANQSPSPTSAINKNNNNLNVPHDQSSSFNQHQHFNQQLPLPGGRTSNSANGVQSAQQSSSLLQQSLQQQQPQQQQRRPRPPKRHQIPSGSGGIQNGQSTSNSNGNNLISSRRPNQLLDFDQPTTRATINNNGDGIGSSAGLPINANFNIQPSAAGGLVDDQGVFPATPPTRTLSHQQQQRPIVAPTTVNFQSREQHQQSPPPPQAIVINSQQTGQQQQQQKFGGTTPTIGGSSVAATTARQQLRPNTSLDQKQPINQAARPRSSQGQQQQQQHQTSARLQGTTSTFAPSDLLLDGQPVLSSSSSSLAKSGGVGGTQSTSSLSSSSSIDQPTSTTTTTTTATAGATATATTSTTTATTTTQDPQQLAANRYLNSAIDALEAGQPFGTVDYDFDILNDNSTDRRNLSGSNLNGGGGNQTATNGNSQTRQRQPSSAANEQDDEGINLTNGQPLSGNNNNDGGGDDDGVGNSNNNNLRPQSASAGRTRTANNKQTDLSSFNTQQQQQTNNAPTTSQQQQQPTKKPRPTNKKIQVNHEQALANNRASIEPAKRPEALFTTPQALQTATKCDNRVCRLPDCKCGDTLNPGGLEAKVIPQIVLLTFDDAVNDLNWEIYEELFTGRSNPNGCPLLATFYVSHEWTDYGQVQTLYSRGHEMASHSITHSFGEKFSKSQWFKEVNGQREILNMYGGVKMNDVRGMRAPFLQIGGNKMFEMLYDANFTYDSSMPIFENSPPMWPYTLDYQLAHECMITPCPTKSFPGVWEVGMTMWVDLRGGRCSMGDACSNPPDEDGVYEMLMKNFNRHYKSNRAPFGLFYHSAWFNTVHHRRGFLRFMSTVNSLPDVFFVTNWQMLQWMRQPTPLSEINSFEPWQCPAKTDRPPPCYHPSVCNVKSEHGTRFMKTCQPCPANQQYPWVGSTGFKGKQAAAAAAASGSG